VARAEETATWGSAYLPGNLLFSLAAGVSIPGSAQSLAADLEIASELFLVKIRPANLFPLDLGLMASGFAGSMVPDGSGRSSIDLGAGAAATIHLGFRGALSDVGPLVSRFELFGILGAVVEYHVLSGDWSFATLPPSGLGLQAEGGLRFFLSDDTTLDLAAGIRSGRLVAGLGLSRRFGAPETRLEDLIPARPAAAGAVAPADAEAAPSERSLSGGEQSGLDAERPGDRIAIRLAAINFDNLSRATAAFVSLVSDDRSFAEGDAVRWRIEHPSDTAIGAIEFEKSLRRILPDGSREWGIEIDEGAKRSRLVLRTDRSDGAELVRVLDEGGTTGVEIVPDNPDAWRAALPDAFNGRRWMADDQTESARISVPAGSFVTRRAEVTEDDTMFTVWFAEKTPGVVVKLTVTRSGRIELFGELLEISTDGAAR
jgi:hypothetical protein